MAGKNDFGYAGIGIAMETLIESAVRVTITHSDSEPIASEAATAWASREEATGAVRPSKPAAPGVRIMVRNPSMRGRITPRDSQISQESLAILGRELPRKWQNGGDSAGSLASGIGPPIQGDVAGNLLDPPQPGPDRREGREIVIAAVGDMGV